MINLSGNIVGVAGLSDKMERYYKDHVAVRKETIDELREKKKLNIDRLEEGLVKYNEENKTNYKLVENLEQGSVAMSTMIQNDSNDYDIDVAIVFDKNDFDVGCIRTKNIIVEALKKKTTQFNKEPEIKTNCIRIYYESGYHLDLAIFRSEGDLYEHCGSEWRERNPRDINTWFLENNEDNNLRVFTRLLKTFCKSRDSWIMPGGLIITILVKEALEGITLNNQRDKDFIEVIRSIQNRLSINNEILNPVNSQTLMLTKDDYTKVNNLNNRLKEQLDKHDQLPADNEKDHNEFWKEFFQDDYWTNQQLQESSAKASNYVFDELQVKNFYRINSNKEIEIKCFKITNKFPTDSQRKLANSFTKNITVHKNEAFVFYINNSPIDLSNHFLMWKIRNYGLDAERSNCIRGQLELSNYKEGAERTENVNYRERIENSSYIGKHTVECFVIDKVHNNIVAKGKYTVEIT